MRTIIDIRPEQLESLDQWCEREGLSRAEAIRRAIHQHLVTAKAGNPEAAFGLWRGRGVDSLAYERRLRGEWDRGRSTRRTTAR